MRARKLFIGSKIRSLRSAAGATQAAFASQLGISTSYLNQIENNQRHVTASVLLALAENHGVDIASLSDQDSDRLLADLGEAVSDPLITGAPSLADMKYVVNSAPAFARAFLATHQALRRATEQLAEIDDTLTRSGALSEPTPYEEVRDFFHYVNNYIHDLDLAGEALSRVIAARPPSRLAAYAAYLERVHGVRVVFAQGRVTLRAYDPASKVLHVNAQSPASSQAFQIAHQIALLEHGATIDAIVAEAKFHSADAAAICRIGLANYFAGATVLPYGPFAEAAKELRHDIHLMADRFGASLEQVAHRLSTLQRPGQKGIPFFFARVDQAGNITKRHSATKLQFARFGSACPLWNVHRAFETPDRIIRQLAETPDGVGYLCLATTVSKPRGGFNDPVQRYAIALGCETVYASEVVYADQLDVGQRERFEPIGVSCRICERRGCHQRAVPPLKRPLVVDGNTRDTIPYSFV